MAYTVFESSMLIIPRYILFAINIVFFGLLSEKLDECSLVDSWSRIWMLPFFIGLLCIKPDASPWVRYTLLSGIAGIPYSHSILVGMTSWNAKKVGKSAANYTGNKILTGLCAANVALFVGMNFFYMWRNRVKTRALEAMSIEERKHLVDTRFAH